MHIVVFPGWYPNKMDKLSGDFIQRHMHAISKFCRVSVVIAVKDSAIKKKQVVVNKNGNLTEIYYYYPALTSIKLLGRFLSFIRYNWYCLKAIKNADKLEKVNLIHLYVLQKNIFTGLLANMIFKISYVISEQSTQYIDGRFDKSTYLNKKIFEWIFNKSKSFHTVSRYLSQALIDKFYLKKQVVIIPNVVDDHVFFYKNRVSNNKVTFVHVSNMTHQKNVEGMLRSFARVRKINNYFLLNLVGPMPLSVNSLVKELGLVDHLIIWNERDYKEVAAVMQQSDVFVFFTRFETFGCVIIEANACGLPVIATDLSVTRELIIDGFNGVFVESESENDLAAKILFMINSPRIFDPLNISSHTRNKYNYDLVGKQFFNWYVSII